MSGLQEQFALFTTQFHWLRPYWLLGFIPLVALAILLFKLKRNAHQWQHMIAPELLPFLLDSKTVAPKKSLLWPLVVAWIIAVIAMAGPSWIKRPTPVEKNQSALVIMLDLSQSMVTEDIKPSRLVRARLKITDIVRARKDGQTALLVYAGEAHAVTPLSDDTATLISLLPSLSPDIMPLPGSNTEDAVQRGIKMLQDAGAPSGDLLLVTDGVVSAAFSKIHELLAGKNIRLNILGVGGQEAAPIPTGSGGFLRDAQGNLVTTQLNSPQLAALAQSNGGRYKDIANDDSDIEYLLPKAEADKKSKPTLERDFDQWFDQGHWLVFLLLPVALLSFRRGFILMLVLVPLLGAAPQSAYAFEWNDLWLTKDQQAARNLQAGDAKAAAQEFKSPDWKAAAQYRASDYAAAAESYAKSDTAEAHYNRGNALAKAGKLEDAIKAYDEALKRNADLADAKKNRDLVEQLLKQQKQQNKDNKNSDNKNNDDKKQDKKDQDQKNQDQQKDQQNKDQKNKDQENKDQKNNDQQKNDQQDKKDQQDQKNQENQKNQDQNSGSQKSSGSNSSQANQQGQDTQQNSSSGSNGSAQNQQQNAGQGSSASTQAQGAQSSAAASMAAGQAQSSAGGEGKEQQAQAQVDQNNLTNEQKKAMEKWLRLVPDDPGGLLRNKFKYQYLKNRQSEEEGDLKLPDNNADQRF